MALEFRIVSRMLDNPDFYEGVRAVVIDKDQSPKWSPATIDESRTERSPAFSTGRHELTEWKARMIEPTRTSTRSLPAG